MGAMMGFERTHSALFTQVENMGTRLPSEAGPSDATDLFRRLVDVEDRARELAADLEEAERKAREDEEREKQRSAWQAQVDGATRDLPERRQELTSAEEQRARIGGQLGATEKELKSANKSSRKDLRARQRKLSDDLQRTNRSIRRLREEISSLEEQAAASFEFRPPANLNKRASRSGGSRFVPQRSKAPDGPQMPREALPKVGELRSYKGKRYLVIDRWEDLQAGERAASRLSARLVAPEGS